MEISFIHTQILVHLHVNKTNCFALRLALKQVYVAVTWGKVRSIIRSAALPIRIKQDGGRGERFVTERLKEFTVVANALHSKTGHDREEEERKK